MQVDKQFFLGEALYRLSVYTKSSCSPNKIWWRKKYVVLLKNLIIFMEKMVLSLSDENITPRDYEVVRQIVENEEIFRFNEVLLSRWKGNNYSLSSINDLSSYKEINQLMVCIIEQLNDAVNSINPINKHKIWYLLQALHNLPKVYLRSQPESIFGHPFPPLPSAEALEYAQDWLKRID